MKNHFSQILFSLAAVLALLFAGCGSAAPTATPTVPTITLTDGLGRTVTLAGPAQRIVSLAPSNTEILFEIGAGAQVVGRDDFSNYPTETASLAGVGGSMGAYNLEAITALQPDLVVAAEINTPEQVKSIEDLGIKVYYLKNPTDFSGLYENLRTMGTLTGRQTEVEALITSLAARVQSVTGKLAAASERPVVFYEIDATDPANPYTAGKGTFIDYLITLAGGTNAAAALDAYPAMSLETLLVDNPNIILLGDANYGISVASVASRAGWDALTAVKNGKVFAFNDDLLSRPTPRWADGLEELAKLIHPELFQ